MIDNSDGPEATWMLRESETFRFLGLQRDQASHSVEPLKLTRLTSESASPIFGPHVRGRPLCGKLARPCGKERQSSTRRNIWSANFHEGCDAYYDP